MRRARGTKAASAARSWPRSFPDCDQRSTRPWAKYSGPAVDDSHGAPSNKDMRKTILVVAGMFSVSLALVTWLGQSIADPAWLALGLALAAICITSYRKPKAGHLQFSPEAFARYRMCPRPTPPCGAVEPR